MPVNHRMHTHKRWPPLIRGIKMRQQRTMRICPPRPNKYGLHLRPILEVFLKRLFHGHGVARERELVVGLGLGDEGVHFGEGVGRDNVHALETGGELGGMRAEGAEEEDEEDEAVFAAVV